MANTTRTRTCSPPTDRGSPRGWRVRLEVLEPSERFLANLAAGCAGASFEALFDVEKIGRGPFSLQLGQPRDRWAGGGHLRDSFDRWGIGPADLSHHPVVKADRVLAVVGLGVDESQLARPGSTRTRRLRAYRMP